MPKVNVSAKEVVQFFKDADLDVAELVLSIGESTVAALREKKAAASQRMAKARAGRGKSKKAEVATPAPAAPAPIRARAPAHTAAATSVESDTAISA